VRANTSSRFLDLSSQLLREEVGRGVEGELEPRRHPSAPLRAGSDTEKFGKGVGHEVQLSGFGRAELSGFPPFAKKPAKGGAAHSLLGLRRVHSFAKSANEWGTHCLGHPPAIGHVDAAGHSRKIVAESIETRSLAVVSPYGKQRLTIDVGDSGMVGLGINDVNGKESISLLSAPSGEPSICLAYEGRCRVVIGDVYRGNQREFSVQLRDKAGNPVWMPDTANPVTSSAQVGPNR